MDENLWSFNGVLPVSLLLRFADAMAITTQSTIKFCNEYVRTSADMLARCYNRGRAIDDEWIAIGGGQTATDILRTRLYEHTNLMIITYIHMFLTNVFWNSNGGAAMVPNNSEPVYDNGSATGQDPSRPPITGAMVNNLINRQIEYVNILDTAFAKDILFQVALKDASDITSSMAGDIINRIRTFRTDYEAAEGAKLNTILAVAVNPV